MFSSHMLKITFDNSKLIWMTLVIVIALVKHKVCYAKKKHSDKRNGSEQCLFLVYCILSPESSRINFLHFPGQGCTTDWIATAAQRSCHILFFEKNCFAWISNQRSCFTAMSPDCREASRKLHWRFQTVPGSAHNWIMFSDITLPLHCIREIGDSLKARSRASNRRNYHCSLCG